MMNPLPYGTTQTALSKQQPACMPPQRAGIGVLGMLAAMLLETSLFIVRQMATERPVPKALRRDYQAAAQRRALAPKRGLWAWLQGGRGQGGAPLVGGEPGGGGGVREGASVGAGDVQDAEEKKTK